MPLIKSASRAAASRNISEMVHSGYPQKQAVAASLRNARQHGAKFADGGATERNRPYVRPIPSTYATAPDAMEPAFRGWLAENKVPFNPDSPGSDYDMRGFYRALMKGDPRARSAVDPNDGRMHYPDNWKTPQHETFSNQSQWATPDAPQWNEKDQLVAPSGHIMFDDRKRDAGPLPRASGGAVAARRYAKQFADGGGTPWIERTSAHGLSHQGMIHSAVPGRTDKLPISVAGGAYILPADHVSALGQGNSQAGADVVNRVFKMGPYAGNPLGRMGGGPKAIRPTVPKLGRMGGKANFARGGAPSVPIIAAGGEYAIPPEKVAELGGGDMDRGHRILDAWVKSTRRQHIKTLRGLKPPKR